jgi:hypothetical protein
MTGDSYASDDEPEIRIDPTVDQIMSQVAIWARADREFLGRLPGPDVGRWSGERQR